MQPRETVNRTEPSGQEEEAIEVLSEQRRYIDRRSRPAKDVGPARCDQERSWLGSGSLANSQMVFCSLLAGGLGVETRK